MTCDLPKAFREYQRKARKDHKCCECRRLILKGSHYIYSSGIWDGGPDSYKTCIRCDRLRKRAIKRYEPDFPDEGPAFGLLLDWIREYRR